MAALVALWHCTQLMLVDCALAWMSAIAGITEKSALVWQFAQVALAEVGMWLAGLMTFLGSKEYPVWQSAHLPLAGCDASATLKGPATDCGRVWKPKYPLIGYWLMLIQT